MSEVPVQNPASAPTPPPEVSYEFHPIRKKIVFVVAILMLSVSTIGIGYWYQTQSKKETDSPKQQAQQKPLPGHAVFNLTAASFAQYKEVPSTIKPVLQPYTLRSNELTNLPNVAKDAGFQFSDEQLAPLSTDGFFTQPTTPSSNDPEKVLADNSKSSRSDDMIDIYSRVGGGAIYDRKPENAVFISSDLMLHTFHVLIDRTFQNIEEKKLHAELHELTTSLFNDSLQRYGQEKHPDMKSSLQRLTAFYLVPLVMLETSAAKKEAYFGSPEEESAFETADESADSPENFKKVLLKYQKMVPTDIFTTAEQELDLTVKATGRAMSPVFSGTKTDPDDYSQYKPRSHYTKNSILRSYFRAMMWYGRHGFEVKNDALTRDSIIMTWQLGSLLVNNKSALSVWEDIYLPTVFYVGQSDDLTVYDYANLMKKIYGESVTFSALNDPAKLQSFQVQAKNLPGPKILSEIKIINPIHPPSKEDLLESTKGFRFMGQRFIPDSYMFSSLTQGDEAPDPETGQKLPSTPTALMIMSIMGSQAAGTLLDEWIKTSAPDSDKVIAKTMNKLKKEFDSYDQATWTQNIYWSWLYSLKPLFDDHTIGYPMFMRGAQWSKKSLQTALGSWTELRHDTLLYAKQSYAEMGGGADLPIPAVPKGYVEPNLSFITRLEALTKLVQQGLAAKGLLSDTQNSKFDKLYNSLLFFQNIAEKELSNAKISDEDFEKLRVIVRQNFPDIVWMPDGGQMTERDARMGIIADVHTDVPKAKVLYEAVGVPSIIYVAIKDKNGVRLTRGGVYSYYEFTGPMATRYSDTDWQDALYDKKGTFTLPDSPAWTKDLMKP